MEPTTNHRMYSVLVVGENEVGKTEMINAYLGKRLRREYVKTHATETSIKHYSSAITLKFYDVPVKYLDRNYKFVEDDIKIVAYVLDPTDESSFDSMPEIIEKVKKIIGDIKVKLIFVSKNDTQEDRMDFDLKSGHTAE